MSQLALLGVQYLGQLGMEHEQADLLGRDHYQRSQAEPIGYRNGYEPAKVKTAEGPVSFRVPQVRGAEEPFRPKILDFILGNSEVLEHLVVEMYARGLSTRDVEDCFRDEAGNPMISRTAVSEITDQLWEDYQQFCSRDLSGIELQVPVPRRRLRVPAPLRRQGRGAGRLGNLRRRPQAAAPPGGGQQGV